MIGIGGWPPRVNWGLRDSMDFENWEWRVISQVMARTDMVAA